MPRKLHGDLQVALARRLGVPCSGQILAHLLDGSVHGWLTSYGANQHVNTSTGFHLSGKVLNKHKTFLQTSSAGFSTNYQNNGTDSYAAWGNAVLFDAQLLYAKYQGNGAGTASVAYTKTVEKVFADPSLTVWGITFTAKVLGRVSAGVYADGYRRDATSSQVGYDRATSRLRSSASLNASVLARHGIDLASFQLELITVAVEPTAYAYDDVDPKRTASERVNYRLGISTPLTLSAGGGKVLAFGKELVNWKGFSDKNNYGNHSTSERFGTTWY